MIYCIGFNGPPRSGKDSVASAVAEILSNETDIPIMIRSLSMPMRKMAFAALGIEYDLAVYEAEKDTPQALWNGDSIRQFMIKYSEKFVKPVYGHEYWARTVAYELERIEFRGILLIPDVGFTAETGFFNGNPGYRFQNVHLARTGISWGHDSRRYCDSDRSILLQNDDQIIDAADRLLIQPVIARLVTQAHRG